MPDRDTSFAGSIPEIYDSVLVPLIFEDAAWDLAARAAARAPATALETAAGSGAVTRALAAALPRSASILATDLNPAMLARASARQTADPRVSWRVADATALPFEDGAFDVVLCQFGAMFFPDRIKGYAEARRTLRPGGAFLFNVWDGLASNGFAAAATEALADLFPDDPPRFLARTPHGHGDPDRMRRELREAGFTRVSVAAWDGTSRAASARVPAEAYVLGTPLRGEIEARGPDALDAAVERVEARIRARWGDGPVSAPIRSFVAEASG